MQDRKETYDKETNPNGRWRRYSAAEISKRKDLDFKWIDFTEKDERSLSEILDEIDAKSQNIVNAVARLRELIGEDEQ